MKTNKTLSILMLAFVVLMSLPWLVPHAGFTALFGFVPLLCMERIARSCGVRRFWLWQYSAFVLWNAVTTFWICNATVGGAVFAILANAAQMSLIFGIFSFSRKKLSGVLPYVFLAAMWIAWERFYFSAEISWPWLVLGNAFARSIRLIQWYEYTGTLGGSLWIWICNLGLFGVMVSLSDGSWQRFTGKARAVSAASLLLFIFGPMLVSASIFSAYDEDDSEGRMDVLIAQPDFDPYQKFQSYTRARQDSILLGQYVRDLPPTDDKVLLLAPETFTSGFWLNSPESNYTWQQFRSFLGSYPNCSILFGASTWEYHATRSAPSPLARPMGEGWVVSHNSAVCMDASEKTEVFHKSRLVVGTEKTPYPKLFVKIDEMLGGVMGRDEEQAEISLLHPCGEPVGCAVCYESVFGEYCTGYVRKGAKALTVITNDAWWGNTPGYRQHLSYSSLRAIELRRDIARCANTGISAFINQKGEIVQSTSWWVPATLRGSVALSSRRTFFVEHGDMAGRSCTLVFLLLGVLLLVSLIPRKA